MSLNREQPNQPNPLKSGTLDVCVKGILSKSWLPRKCLLFPAWNGRPALIQYHEVPENDEKKPPKKESKIFNLKDLQKVAVKQKGKENQLVVTTKKDKIVFMSKDHMDIHEWENYLQPLVAKSTQDTDSATEDGISNDGSDDVQYEADVLIDENIIYDSIDPKFQFDVKVERNCDAERVNLAGEFLLVVNDFTLTLLDKKYNTAVCMWPYKYIRRYGRTPDIFSFEAGRRCSTGPGWFSFFTTFGNEIFQLAQGKLKKMQQDEMAMSREITLKQESVHKQNNPKPNSAENALKENSKVSKDDSNQGQDRSESTVSDKKSTETKKEKEKREKEKKEKEKKDKKAEKLKTKEEKSQKQKMPKNAKALTLNTNGQVPPGEIKVGTAVLPVIDPNQPPRLRHVENSSSGKTPPATAVKPKLTGKMSDPMKPKTSPKPEQLYALPEGKGVSHIAFPKSETLLPVNQEVKFTPKRHTTAYEEIDAKDAPGKITESASFPYSEIETPKKPWKTHGLESEDHIEHYAGTDIIAAKEDVEYELTEVGPITAKMYSTKPFMNKDLPQDFCCDDYDHLNIQSVKHRHVPDKRRISDIYSHTNASGPTSHDAESTTVTLNNTGNEYEEAVLMPRS